MLRPDRVPTTMTSYLRLLLGATSFDLVLARVHFWSIGPSGMRAFRGMEWTMLLGRWPAVGWAMPTKTGGQHPPWVSLTIIVQGDGVGGSEKTTEVQW